MFYVKSISLCWFCSFFRRIWLRCGLKGISSMKSIASQIASQPLFYYVHNLWQQTFSVKLGLSLFFDIIGWFPFVLTPNHLGQIALYVYNPDSEDILSHQKPFNAQVYIQREVLLDIKTQFSYTITYKWKRTYWTSGGFRSVFLLRTFYAVQFSFKFRSSITQMSFCCQLFLCGYYSYIYVFVN